MNTPTKEPKQVSIQTRLSFKRKPVEEGWKTTLITKELLPKYLAMQSYVEPNDQMFHEHSTEIVDTGDGNCVLLKCRIADVEAHQKAADAMAREQVLAIYRDDPSNPVPFRGFSGKEGDAGDPETLGKAKAAAAKPDGYL